MRLFLICFFSLSILVRSNAPRPLVAVVTSTEVEAYSQAVAGIREQIPDVPVWDARDEAGLRQKLAALQPEVVIAVGSSAALAVGRAAPPRLPIVNGVVLASDIETGGDTSRVKTSVTVDLSPEVLLSEVARLFPDVRRIGMIRGPRQNDTYMKAFERAAHRYGLTVEAITCDHPRNLVEAFLKLRSRADLVWCPPNSQLYNSATLKPLLIASLTNRLPILGFSDQFVQAGALFGGSADFIEVGRQTAAAALNIVRNEPVPVLMPARKFRFAYNQRVARLLGLKALVTERTGELVMIR
jgi:ABC-type uncharacterized transport system substrate-binding protein